LSYANAPAAITPARVAEVIRLTAEGLGRIKKGAVRLGVCGLNPHGGEQGLFGSEEADLIIPGIEEARNGGIDVSGPLPPDAAFTERVRGSFDALVCQYHDQGHIPFKMLAFDRGVNVTLGLPIVRTSVDHGTAFDIAWKGVADAGSLGNAIRLAVDLCGA
jgi:4-hydroxythreonine-4-phosphate dehydrogenase